MPLTGMHGPCAPAFTPQLPGSAPVFTQTPAHASTAMPACPTGHCAQDTPAIAARRDCCTETDRGSRSPPTLPSFGGLAVPLLDSAEAHGPSEKADSLVSHCGLSAAAARSTAAAASVSTLTVPPLGNTDSARPLALQWALHGPPGPFGPGPNPSSIRLGPTDAARPTTVGTAYGGTESAGLRSDQPVYSHPNSSSSVGISGSPPEGTLAPSLGQADSGPPTQVGRIVGGVLGGVLGTLLFLVLLVLLRPWCRRQTARKCAAEARLPDFDRDVQRVHRGLAHAFDASRPAHAHACRPTGAPVSATAAAVNPFSAMPLKGPEGWGTDASTGTPTVVPSPSRGVIARMVARVSAAVGLIPCDEDTPRLTHLFNPSRFFNLDSHAGTLTHSHTHTRTHTGSSLESVLGSGSDLAAPTSASAFVPVPICMSSADDRGEPLDTGAGTGTGGIHWLGQWRERAVMWTPEIFEHNCNSNGPRGHAPTVVTIARAHYAHDTHGGRLIANADAGPDSDGRLFSPLLVRAKYPELFTPPPEAREPLSLPGCGGNSWAEDWLVNPFADPLTVSRSRDSPSAFSGGGSAGDSMMLMLDPPSPVATYTDGHDPSMLLPVQPSPSTSPEWCHGQNREQAFSREPPPRRETTSDAAILWRPGPVPAPAPAPALAPVEPATGACNLMLVAASQTRPGSQLSAGCYSCAWSNPHSRTYYYNKANTNSLYLPSYSASSTSHVSLPTAWVARRRSAPQPAAYRHGSPAVYKLPGDAAGLDLASVAATVFHMQSTGKDTDTNEPAATWSGCSATDPFHVGLVSSASACRYHLSAKSLHKTPQTCATQPPPQNEPSWQLTLQQPPQPPSPPPLPLSPTLPSVEMGALSGGTSASAFEDMAYHQAARAAAAAAATGPFSLPAVAAFTSVACPPSRYSRTLGRLDSEVALDRAAVASVSVGTDPAGGTGMCTTESPPSSRLRGAAMASLSQWHVAVER